VKFEPPITSAKYSSVQISQMCQFKFVLFSDAGLKVVFMDSDSIGNESVALEKLLCGSQPSSGRSEVFADSV
jgi:hypothetical protein